MGLRQIPDRDVPREAHVALAKARVNALVAQPYLASAVLPLRVVWSEECPSVGVDYKGRLYLNPVFVRKTTREVMAGALLHEAWHLLRERGRRRGGRDPDAWNTAGDAEINDDIPGPNSGARARAGDDWIFPLTIAARDGLTAEMYYREPQAKPTTMKSAQPCGGGSGAGVPQPWELGEDGPPPITDAEANRIRQSVAAEIKNHASAHPGSIPLDMLRWADDQIEPPKLDWRRELRAVVSREMVRAMSGAQDFTFTQVERYGAVLLPMMVGFDLRVCVVVDTSASVYESQLQQAAAELGGILRSVREVIVIGCDAAVGATIRARSAKQATRAFVGGGGTEMGVGLLEAEKHKADVTIVITDGETYWPQNKPKCGRIIVALYEGTSEKESVPSWAKAVVIS